MDVLTFGVVFIALMFTFIVVQNIVESVTRVRLARWQPLPEPERPKPEINMVPPPFEIRHPPG